MRTFFYGVFVFSICFSAYSLGLLLLALFYEAGWYEYAMIPMFIVGIMVGYFLEEV